MFKISKLIFTRSCSGELKRFKVSAKLARYCSSRVKDDLLEIQLNNSSYTFPTVWLRDNCQCKYCFHQNSQSRIINWKIFDTNVKVKSVDNCKNKEEVIIIWEDDHFSTFDKEWLRQRNFSKQNGEEYLKSIYRHERKTWDKNNFEAILRKYEYNSILEDNSALNNWLQTLRQFGVAIIKNVPESEEAGTRVANRVEFVRRTHYGQKFAVKAKVGTTNVAYLSSNLQIHTDLPYYEYKPGVNLLHCIAQAQGPGGENLLADGLYVAEYLKLHNTKSYNILTNTLVNWEDIGEESTNRFHSIFRSPVICENLEGNIVRINHSVPQRGSHFNIPTEEVKPWYQAMKLFVDMIHQNAALYKMAPGEILCFDNLRILHGRHEYQDTPDNTRCVIGVYLDWDYIFSRIRVLSKI